MTRFFGGEIVCFYCRNLETLEMIGWKAWKTSKIWWYDQCLFHILRSCVQSVYPSYLKKCAFYQFYLCAFLYVFVLHVEKSGTSKWSYRIKISKSLWFSPLKRSQIGSLRSGREVLEAGPSWWLFEETGPMGSDNYGQLIRRQRHLWIYEKMILILYTLIINIHIYIYIYTYMYNNISLYIIVYPSYICMTFPWYSN